MNWDEGGMPWTCLPGEPSNVNWCNSAQGSELYKNPPKAWLGANDHGALPCTPAPTVIFCTHCTPLIFCSMHDGREHLRRRRLLRGASSASMDAEDRLLALQPRIARKFMSRHGILMWTIVCRSPIQLH